MRIGRKLGVFAMLAATAWSVAIASELPENGVRSSEGKGRTAPDDIAISQESHPALFQNLTEMANRWKRVIQNRDMDGLVAFASDDYKMPVREKLADRNSNVYRMFLDENGPVFGFYRRVPSPRLAFIGHQRAIGIHGTKEIYGVTVCSYDKSKVYASTSREILGMLDREITQPNDILCLYFSRDDQHWSPNFEFDTEN